MFELFDIKQNSVIEFGEFVRSLSVFHPEAPLAEKAKCGLGLAAPEVLHRVICCATRFTSKYCIRSRVGSSRGGNQACARQACLLVPAGHAVVWHARLAAGANLRRLFPPASAAVAFRIYDIGGNNRIERYELNQGQAQSPGGLAAAVRSDGWKHQGA